MAEIQLTSPNPSGEDVTLVMRGLRADIEPNILEHIAAEKEAGRAVIPMHIEGDGNDASSTAAILRAIADALDPPADPSEEESE